MVVCARWCPALPRPVGRSTMGAGVLSFRVRDGSGRVLPAMTTETCVGLCGALPPRFARCGWVVGVSGCLVSLSLSLLCCGVWLLRVCGWVGRGPYSGRGWFACGGVGGVLCWPVSTSQLRSLPIVHVWPIYPVVCWGPSTPAGVWRPGLEDGFPLRCFQRLSVSERG